MQPTLAERSLCAKIREYNKAGRFDKAEDLALEGILSFPESKPIRLQHALVALYRDDLHAAVERLETIRGQLGTDAEIYRWSVNALRRAQHIDEAATLLEDALAAFPQDEDLHIERAWFINQTGTHAEASAEWERIRTAFPARTEGYWVGAHRALQAGQLAEAEEICRAGYERFPTNGHILWQWAISANRRRDWDEARRRWAVAASLHPDMAEVRAGIGEFELGRQLDGFHSSSPSADAVQGTLATVSELGDLLMRFESLGSNCEFGIIQRLAGVEPLGLLRWANITPRQLAAMLDTNFDGVGDASNTALEVTATGEYSLIDTRYFGMHTFIQKGGMPEERVLQSCLRRLRFLTEKLANDIASAEKILVYKWHRGPLNEADIDAIFTSVRRHGRAKLLCVHKACAVGANRRVSVLREDLFLASMPELTADPHAAKTRAGVWHEICHEVLGLNG